MRISSKSPRTALPRKRQESQGLEGAVAHWVESALTPATCGLQSPSLIPQPVKLLQNQKINGKSFKNSSVKSRRFTSGLPSGSRAGAVVALRDTWSRFSRSGGQQGTRLLPAQCPLRAFLGGVIDVVLLQVQCPPPGCVSSGFGTVRCPGGSSEGGGLAPLTHPHVQTLFCLRFRD